MLKADIRVKMCFMQNVYFFACDILRFKHVVLCFLRQVTLSAQKNKTKQTTTTTKQNRQKKKKKTRKLCL